MSLISHRKNSCYPLEYKCTLVTRSKLNLNYILNGDNVTIKKK